MDKISSNTLSHDLMTQQAVLESLRLMASASGSELDLEQFLRNSRESRDILMPAGLARPDLLYVNPDNNVAYGYEVERSVKGGPELRNKMWAGLRLAGSAGFRRYTIEYVVRGGDRVVQRYSRCWEDVLEEARRDGLSVDVLSRVHCKFRTTDYYRGFR